VPITCLFAATTILCFPILRWGLPRGNDSIEHIQWYFCFSQQFWRGDLFPRWLASMNAGLGSPSMFVYGPLPYYAASLLHPLLANAANPANLELGVTVWLATAFSGVAAYLWLRLMAGQLAALAGALAYLIVPYHLNIDLYTRAAVPELWAFAWMPLILYFATGAIQTPAKSTLVGLAVSYALLISTHLVATLLFTPLLVAYAVFVAQPGLRMAALTRCALGMALGLGLSAVYALPALAHQQNVSAARFIELRPNSLYSNHFLFSGPGRNLGAGNDQFLRKLSWWTVFALGVCLAAFAWVWSLPKRAAKPELFWIAVAVVSMCMMLPVSAFIWSISGSLQAVQFPWRYNMILMLAMSALMALAMDQLRISIRSWRIVPAAVIAISAVPWLAVDLRALAGYQGWKPEVTKLVVGDYLMPSWARWTEAKYMTPEGLLELGEEDALAKVTGVRDAEFQAAVESPQWVTLRRFYYPTWQAQTSQGLPLAIRPAPSTGLIQVEVLAGEQKIHLKLPWGVWEKLGLWISAISTVITACLLLNRWRRRSAGSLY
jgi:hypothetical protein